MGNQFYAGIVVGLLISAAIVRYELYGWYWGFIIAGFVLMLSWAAPFLRGFFDAMKADIKKDRLL